MDEKKDEKREERYADKVSEKLLKTRSIMIYGEIDQELAQRVSAQLLILQEMGDEPINVYINSQGGHVESGDTIHDMLKFVKPEIKMIGTGWVASAGITIYLAAKKENRFSLPNTRYMIHQPSGGTRGPASDIKIDAEQIVKIRSRVNKLISDATGQPLDKVEQDTQRNFWLDAEAAKEYGIVSKIITNNTEV